MSEVKQEFKELAIKLVTNTKQMVQNLDQMASNDILLCGEVKPGTEAASKVRHYAHGRSICIYIISNLELLIANLSNFDDPIHSAANKIIVSMIDYVIEQNHSVLGAGFTDVLSILRKIKPIILE